MDSEFMNENLQMVVVAAREKYTVAIEKLLHKHNKLQITYLEKEVEQLRETLKSKYTLQIPNFNIDKNLKSDVLDTKNDEVVKSALIQQIRSMEVLTKMMNCPVAQEVAKL